MKCPTIFCLTVRAWFALPAVMFTHAHTTGARLVVVSTRVRGYLDRLSWHKRHLRRKTMIASLQGNFTGKTFPIPTDPELDYFPPNALGYFL